MNKLTLWRWLKTTATGAAKSIFGKGNRAGRGEKGQGDESELFSLKASYEKRKKNGKAFLKRRSRKSGDAGVKGKKQGKGERRPSLKEPSSREAACRQGQSVTSSGVRGKDAGRMQAKRGEFTSPANANSRGNENDGRERKAGSKKPHRNKNHRQGSARRGRG